MARLSVQIVRVKRAVVNKRFCLRDRDISFSIRADIPGLVTVYEACRAHTLIMDLSHCLELKRSRLFILMRNDCFQ